MGTRNFIAAVLVAIFLSGCWAHHDGFHNFHDNHGSHSYHGHGHSDHSGYRH